MAKRAFFRIPDLSGGLNPDQNPVLIADNEATGILNFRLDKMGSLVSRRGYARYSTAATPATIKALGRWSPPSNPGTSQVLATLSDGKLVVVNPVAALPADHTVKFTGLANAVGEFVGIGDEVAYVNGTDLPVLYDGTTAVSAGIAAPTIPTLTRSAGSMTGSVSYAYTLYDSGRNVESNPSPIASTTLASQQVTLGALPDSHARATHLRIYRTDLNGGVLYRLAQVAIVAATTTYLDDGSLTPNPLLPLEYDNGLPLAFEHTAYVKGFTFGSKGNTIYWSKAYRPENWAPLDYTEVPFEGNDTIVGMWAHQDTLVVFGRRNLVLVAGSGAAANSGQGWSLSRADIDTGAVNGRVFAEIDGSLVYLSHAGLRVFPGSGRLAPKLDRVFAAMTRVDIEKATLTYVPEERSLWVALPTGVYVIHIPNQAVSWYDFKTHYVLPGGSDGFSLPLFVDTALLQVNSYGSEDDVGLTIPVLWRSKIFQLNNPETMKFFRRIGAFASRGSGASVTVTITDQSATFRVPLTATSNEGEFNWGDHNWAPDADALYWSAEGVAYFIGALPAQTLRGHTMQIIIDADVSEETEIVSPITFEYREANRFLGQ